MSSISWSSITWPSSVDDVGVSVFSVSFIVSEHSLSKKSKVVIYFTMTFVGNYYCKFFLLDPLDHQHQTVCNWLMLSSEITHSMFPMSNLWQVDITPLHILIARTRCSSFTVVQGLRLLRCIEHMYSCHDYQSQ